MGAEALSSSLGGTTEEEPTGDRVWLVSIQAKSGGESLILYKSVSIRYIIDF